MTSISKIGLQGHEQQIRDNTRISGIHYLEVSLLAVAAVTIYSAPLCFIDRK